MLYSELEALDSCACSLSSGYRPITYKGVYLTSSVKVERVDSLPELVDAAIQLLPEGELFWFRGVTDSAYSLVPKAYRNPKVVDGKDFLEREEQLMLSRFRQRAMPYLPASHSELSNAALLVHMQHYGAPTRLLDWTENLLVAAYFSVSAQSLNDEKSPAIWALRPAAWNSIVYSDLVDNEIPTFDSTTIRPHESPLMRWLPLSPENRSSTMKKDSALAAYATHSNDRIRAQQGVFTVAGTNTEGLEKQVDAQPSEIPILYKFTFTGGAKKLKRELSQVGYIRSLIYPGLESICNQIDDDFWSQ